MSEIKILAKVEKEVEVTIHVDELVEAINDLSLPRRWNYIAKMINDIRVDEIEELGEKHARIIKNYLHKQTERFNKIQGV